MSNRVSKPSNKHRGRKIPDAQWECNRDRIIHLWLEDGDDGRKLDEIVKIMGDRHKFHATAAQYHNRFVKKWNIRKNVTKNEWRKLYWDNADRRQAREDYEVFFNGRLLTSEQKSREWERYGFASESRPGDLSPLPETFEYRPCDTTYVPNPVEQLSSLVSNHMRINESNVNPITDDALVRTAPSQMILGSRSHVFLDTSVISPFSWSFWLDWTKLTKLVGHDHQIVHAWRPDLNQLNAMFYSQNQTPLTVATATTPLLLQHLVSSIINGVTHAKNRTQGDVFHLLITLPRQAVSKFFKALPTETVDIVRQRLREAALRYSKPDTVQALLELEQSLCVSTFRAEAEVFAVLDRLKTCDEIVAPIIVRYASRVSREQDIVLSRLLSIFSGCKSNDLRLLKFVALMQIPIEAGASLTEPCFFVRWHTRATLEELIRLEESDILVWIERGLLATATQSISQYGSLRDNTLLNWILSSLKRHFHQQLTQDMWTDHDAAATCCALVNAFQAALDRAYEWLIEAIYDTSYQLACFLHYSQTDFDLNNTVMQACSDRDWKRAYQAVSEAKPAIVGQPYSNYDVWRRAEEQMSDAVILEDLDEIEALFDMEEEVDPWDAFDTAIENNCHNATALLATYFGNDRIIDLLADSKVQAISTLLCEQSHWTEIIQKLNREYTYDDLEDILYHKIPHKSCRQFPCCLDLSRLETQQIVLRVMSYHAIHKRDTAFLDWLQQHDLAIEGILVARNEDMDILELQTLSSQKSKLLNPNTTGEYDIRLPSLIEVATQLNDVTMIGYLLSQRLVYRDSDALLHAVKTKAQMATIRILLQVSCPMPTGPIKQYGSAALRCAIRDKNHELVGVLAKATDIHGLEGVFQWEGCLNYLDPLGEAIFRKDCVAVGILIENGGNPNAIVAFDGLHEHTPRTAENSVLSRMTALLVAIDVGDFTMVQFLVERGANVNRESTMGVLRTPLQRAAEIGDFEMAQYFISQGAIVDAAPRYGGATALQLAAMSGHLGIAALLIEHGADVNHPPARGPGRTAFEAAAEWCRPDMMHFLVQHGAQLELEIEEEIDESSEPDGMVKSTIYHFTRWRPVHKWRTQYERALQFAEDRGEHASKRVVEAIAKQLQSHRGDDLSIHWDENLHTSVLQEIELPVA
ncbi:hypothetical protein C7974DRAFT_474931 [Boeremia exigua]|uniref:uncharacterized protein n=1 Tax=Boeremia exigua TaxID=749465 RepID=UPI001E8E730D|nr:uncharacterized protein C7974DRAFT_474931 [Boeremia exigua]KAH6616456.1 hypothetical protein C7974DRAFT_474931 [Boeremia exigua]